MFPNYLHPHNHRALNLYIIVRGHVSLHQLVSPLITFKLLVHNLFNEMFAFLNCWIPFPINHLYFVEIDVSVYFSLELVVKA